MHTGRADFQLGINRVASPLLQGRKLVHPLASYPFLLEIQATQAEVIHDLGGKYRRSGYFPPTTLSPVYNAVIEVATAIASFTRSATILPRSAGTKP